MAEPTYDPYAYSDIGKRALGGEYINSMNFFWFDPVTGEEGQTTEGWSRVPDSVKPYTYLEPGSRNEARNTFYESGAAFGGAGGLSGGMGGGGLLSGQAYAQQIAGGMPFEQVVAPGMSFSPDQPMGYTAQGATPFQPRPAFFPSVQDPSVGMTGADLGLPMGAGTPMPAGTTFDPDSIRQMAPVAPAGVSASAIANLPVELEPLDVEGLLANVDVDELLKNIKVLSNSILNNSKIKTIKKEYLNIKDELDSFLKIIKKINGFNLGSMCICCLSNPVTMCFNPCGHTACAKCCEKTLKMTYNDDACPLCRKPIQTVKKLYII